MRNIGCIDWRIRYATDDFLVVDYPRHRVVYNKKVNVYLHTKSHVGHHLIHAAFMQSITLLLRHLNGPKVSIVITFFFVWHSMNENELAVTIATVLISLVLFMYYDSALFCLCLPDKSLKRYRLINISGSGWQPIIGHLRELGRNYHRILDYILDESIKADWKPWTILLPFNNAFIMSSDPKNVS